MAEYVVVCRNCDEEQVWADAFTMAFHCVKCGLGNKRDKLRAEPGNGVKRVKPNVDETRRKVWCLTCLRPHVRNTKGSPPFKCTGCGGTAIGGSMAYLIPDDEPIIDPHEHKHRSPNMRQAISLLMTGSKKSDGRDEYWRAFWLIAREIRLLEKTK